LWQRAGGKRVIAAERGKNPQLPRFGKVGHAHQQTSGTSAYFFCFCAGGINPGINVPAVDVTLSDHPCIFQRLTRLVCVID